MYRKFHLPVLFLLLAVFLGLGLWRDSGLLPAPLIKRQAPEFKLEDLADINRSFDTRKLRGQVWLLNVWASWCVACRAEHPHLMQLAGNGKLNLYGLNYRDRRSDALRWLAFYGNPYRLTAHDGDGAVGASLGVRGVPETFVIDRRGRIRYQHSGPLTEEVLQNVLPELIERIGRES